MCTLTQLAAPGRPAPSSDRLCSLTTRLCVLGQGWEHGAVPPCDSCPALPPTLRTPCSLFSCEDCAWKGSLLSQSGQGMILGSLHSPSQAFPQSSLLLADQSRPRTQPLGKMERIHFNPVVVDGHKTLWSFGLNIFHGLTLDFYSNDPHCFC